METQTILKTDVISKAISIAVANGGTTYNLNTNAPVVANGPTYVVGLMTDASAIFDLSDSATIEAHILRNWNAFANNWLGLWVNDGKLYIDVSAITDNKEFAIHLGKINNQIAIFDLLNFAEVPTGGTGELA